MASSINYASVPVGRAVVLTVGDNSRTGPASYQVAVPAAYIPNGMQIERLREMPLATVTATVVRYWAYRAVGATWRLLLEIPVGAQTVTAGGAVSPNTAEAVTQPNVFPIIVEPGEEVRVSINDNQTGVQATVEGGGY